MQYAAISCLGITSLYDHVYCGLDILQVCSWFFPGYILDGGCHFGLFRSDTRSGHILLGIIGKGKNCRQTENGYVAAKQTLLRG